MVIFLITNILNCLVIQRWADGENTVSTLPSEIFVMFRNRFNPSAAMSFWL